MSNTSTSYKTASFRRLKEQQLSTTPPQACLQEIDRTKRLLGELDPHREYRSDELCQRISAKRPEIVSDSVVNGADAIHDLRLFVRDLSDRADISAESCDEPVLTIEDVSRRFNVSTKTVDRWRRRGLASRQVLVGNRMRVGFSQSSVDRFASQHPDIVQRGARFSRMTDAEREEIIRRARQLAEEGVRPAEATGLLTKEFNFSQEAIRLAIKKHDHKHPDSAICRRSSTRLTEETKEEVFRSFQCGAPFEELAKKHGRSKAGIKRIIREMRTKRLWDEPIKFVDNESFEDPQAVQEILGPAPQAPPRKRFARAPADLPAYLASLYRNPVLNQEEETHYFRKMNYLKFQAARLRDQLDPERAKLRELDRIEGLLKEAADIKNLLIRRNLRLVVSIAKTYFRQGTTFFELISEGNVSLMRAIDRFDYSKGFKLSTYATWAIKNNFIRSVPSEFSRRQRFRTGQDELFHQTQDARTSRYEQERTNQLQNDALTRVLNRLRERDREIIESRFGLNRDVEPQTLEQIGNRLGVSKERIRQLEARALNTLREIIVDEKLDVPGI